MKSMKSLGIAVGLMMGINITLAEPYSYDNFSSLNYPQFAYSNYYRQHHIYHKQRYRNDQKQSHSTARFPSQIRASGERIFVFSPRHKKWAAYDKSGNRVAHGRANGGSQYCADLGRPCRTPVGTFRVHRKGDVSCVSNKFPVGRGGAPMPYCMFFHGGYAIHGSPYISNVNGSHGCIRVTTSAASWLHSNFMNHGTKVIVLSY